MSELHPIIEAAAEGELPDWSVYGKKRYKHMQRVAELMRDWARTRGISDHKIKRWSAVGYLHDALRNEKPKRLRLVVPPRFKKVPGPLLHGPAVAEKLRHLGVKDEKLLLAIQYHTTGSRHLSTIGRALFAADFLEPGRSGKKKWRARRRERVPTELDEVVLEILEHRITKQLEKTRPVRPETMGMWNAMTRGKRWAHASEV